MNRRPIVGVNHVTGRAAAVAIIAGMIVGAGQRQNRIQQARLLQAEKHGIGSQLGAQAAIAQLHVRTPRIFFRIRNADLRTLSPAPLEHAQNVAGLRDFPAGQRIQIRQDAFQSRQLLRRRRIIVQALRDAVGRIAFAEMRVLVRKPAVVVERRFPQHRARGHHAGADREHFLGVTTGGAAGLRAPRADRPD